ncbi:hypothetical protein EGW08_021123, partial [Elysia chlorotica]
MPDSAWITGIVSQSVTLWGRYHKLWFEPRTINRQGKALVDKASSVSKKPVSVYVSLCGLQDMVHKPVRSHSRAGNVFDGVKVELVQATYRNQAHHNKPGTKNGRYAREATTSDSVMPTDLHFRVQMGSRDVDLRVRRSVPDLNKDGKKDVADFPVFVIEDGHIKRKRLLRQPNIGLYANDTSGSSFVVRKTSSRSDFILEGIFYEGLDQLHLTRDAKGGLHRIHKQPRVVDFRDDYVNMFTNELDNAKVDVGSHRYASSGKVHLVHGQRRKRRRKRRMSSTGGGESTEHEVQLFMVADNKDYQTWLKYYGYNSTLTEIEMNLYYSFIANSMNVRYSSVGLVDPSFQLTIIITGLLIVNVSSVGSSYVSKISPKVSLYSDGEPVEPGLYQAIFAMERTSCGDGKWCMLGQCAPHPAAPRMRDSCPQGDDPTAPCVREDCPYYTARTKLVYCCKTCLDERMFPPTPAPPPLPSHLLSSAPWLGLVSNRVADSQVVRRTIIHHQKNQQHPHNHHQQQQQQQSQQALPTQTNLLQEKHMNIQQDQQNHQQKTQQQQQQQQQAVLQQKHHQQQQHMNILRKHIQSFYQKQWHQIQQKMQTQLQQNSVLGIQHQLQQQKNNLKTQSHKSEHLNLQQQQQQPTLHKQQQVELQELISQLSPSEQKVIQMIQLHQPQYIIMQVKPQQQQQQLQQQQTTAI